VAQTTERLGVLAIPAPIDCVFLAIGLLATSIATPVMADTDAPALAIAFWRCAVGAVFAAAFVGHRWPSVLRRADSRSLKFSVFSGVMLAANFALWTNSLKMTTVAAAAALVSVQVVFAALIAWRLGDRMPAMAWVGSAIAVVSVALVTGADFHLSTRAVMGDVLAVITGIFGALYFTTGAVARARLSAFEFSAICFAVAAIALLACCAVARAPLAGYTAHTWLQLAGIALGAQVLGHLMFSVALRTTSATMMSLVVLGMVPISGVVAFVWLGQHPPLTAFPGIVLLLIGAVLVIRSRERPMLVAPPE
jgi:drug/metabolite transporter (DMT)-like permease